MYYQNAKTFNILNHNYYACNYEDSFSSSQSTVPEADSSDPPSSGGIVGGAIVGVVLVGVVVIMVCAVLVSVKHRSKRERLKIQEQSGSTISVHGKGMHFVASACIHISNYYVWQSQV